MEEPLKKITTLLIKTGFLKILDIGQLDSVSLGPLALLLANNIQKEWFSSSVMKSDMKSFSFNSTPSKKWQEDCQTSYNHALQALNGQLPFCLTSVFSVVLPNSQAISLINSSCTYGYRRLVFINRKESQQYFYRYQRQRRIFWRKLSMEPERFQIEEDNQDGYKESVKITASFPWATEVLETIYNHGSEPLEEYKDFYQAKVGRKTTLPHVIESVCLENPVVMTYLWDAVQQLPSRTLLRLHCTLAPYKTAVAVDQSDEKNLEDLKDLGRFISLSFKRAGLHSLQSSGSQNGNSLDAQLSANDLVGIPYTVVVVPNSLTNGIVHLRSRDTTLQEQVHISKLTPYMKLLLNQ